MESAPINLAAPLDRRRALLAKLMAQAQAGGRPPAGGGFRAGVLGGRSIHNASDLMAAPLPQINMGFRPAAGMTPPGFRGDPWLPQTPFPDGTPPQNWLGGEAPAGSPTPPSNWISGPPDAAGGGSGIGPTMQAPPPSYDGPVRSFTGYDPPDPWAVFRTSGRTARF